jgi:hypothetical protein
MLRASKTFTLRIKMKNFLFFTLLTSSYAFAADTGFYVNEGIWTGNNSYSSAPSPACSCDKNTDKADCSASFSGDDQGNVCYDEFIPDGSEGWVHANIFIKR